MYSPYGNIAQNLQHPQPQHASSFLSQSQYGNSVPQPAPGQQQQQYFPQVDGQGFVPGAQGVPAQGAQGAAPGQAGGAPYSAFLNDPATSMAAQFAKSSFGSSNQYIQQNFGSFIPGTLDLNYYFKVSNSYVMKKIGLILFPYRNKNWNRLTASDPAISLGSTGIASPVGVATPGNISFAPPAYDGSTSARFVKNGGGANNYSKKNSNTIRSEFKGDRNESIDPSKLNPMLNDSIQKKELVTRIDQLDSVMGFDRIENGELDGLKPRKGYSGVDYYFLDEEGGSFKATIKFDPYFYLAVIPGHEAEVEEMLKKFLEPCHLKNIARLDKEDLALPNHLYQDLVDSESLKYKTRSENSILFEVDGPYKAMILPTSKEEGKGLKKRYAVFNDDGSLAELKGFELKRRGELQLIKNFQSDIFKLFLDGDSLEGCYQAVASVANNWLDVLDTKGGMLEDEDLIELICENRSMSKALVEYEGQKSTSITTAKRLGEFLGEGMVKDAGLACKYIISSKPIGSPVTERAIPVSIFSSEKKEFFLKKWLKDPSLSDFDPRSVIDWDYYYERLASVVQKIITIPAALQDVKNPVPRVPHPDWLQKRIKIKDDTKQQSSISKFFGKSTKSEALQNQVKHIQDIEDFGELDSGISKTKVGKVTSRKRRNGKVNNASDTEEEERNNAVLNGPCPLMTEDYVGYLQYQKAKWKVQAKNRERRRKLFGNNTESSHRSSVGGLFRKQAESVAGSDWEILEYKPDPTTPGDVKVYILSGNKVHSFIFHIPKQIYATFKTDISQRKYIQNCEIEKSNAILPNGHDGSHLYKFVMPEPVYNEQISKIDSILQDSKILGLYESNINSVDRAIINLGNTVKFDDTKVGALGKGLKNGFNMKDLSKIEKDSYLKRFNMDIVYLLHIVTNSYEFFTVFKTWDNSANMFVLKPSSNAQELPTNIHKIYQEVYENKKDKLGKLYNIIDYPSEMSFDTNYYNSRSSLYKKLNTFVSKIHESRSNKALFTIQSPYVSKVLVHLPAISNFPTIRMNVTELSLPAIGWQSLITKRVINHFFVLASWIKNLISLSNYGKIPLCNLQTENMGYLIDIEYARRLSYNNIVLWWSANPLPDHGGFEADKTQDLESFDFPTINSPEIYETACLEVEIGTLTINTILTSSLINEAEGADLAEDSMVFDQNNGTSTMAEDSFSTPSLKE
ncbi:DNA polymerase epsilon catalytic subunit [Cerrena zonata]|uniref:DNA polymerase epsilon catalytic subunit n=1 Tax=Cerrena zonata TaxID=2478898 RepID=A0AAW0FIL7_9APHY